MSFQAHIATLRLQAQQLVKTHCKTPQDLVSYMGVLQAQDFVMVKWAIGVRLLGTTEKEIEDLIDNGVLLRTHLLRPTWHLVSAEDIYWLLDVTAPHVKASQKSRHKQLEITEEVVKKSHSTIEKALKNTSQLTRDELVEALEKAHIVTNENRAAHLLFMAELDGILCSGTGHGKSSTYALLHERVPQPAPIPKEEALAKLSLLYFTSRGPATVQDFENWSGLSTSESKKGLEMIKEHLISEKIAEQTFWWKDVGDLPKVEKEKVMLLPAFDEFVMSYKDRSAVLSSEHHKIAVSNNGIFWPTILQNGCIVGIWKRTLKKDAVVVEPQFFNKPSQGLKKQVEKEAKQYGRFLGLKVDIRI